MSSASTGQDPASAQGAVFLSYAREDSVAAKRIADALRGFGVEVWFDQTELRGGDAWDAKIRNQVKTCALFVPIISSTTQSRGEGYFRREWKLAVERTHDMAEHIPFILPVVIDATTEAAAFVPDQFRRVQWTGLPGGAPTPQFVEHVKRLLAAPGPASPQGAGKASPQAASPKGRSLQTPLLAVVVVAVGAALYFALRPAPREPVAAAQPAPSAPKIDNKSIAVLPFENMSEDKENNAFFADGIHEDILTNLALVQELRVVSRTSVMQYRSTTKPIRQIGQELGVAYILEGSVRRAGNKVRVTGQLIRAATDEHIWAKAYDRDLTDVFAIQGELAQEIANALQAALSPETRKIIERRPTENLAAYDLWLKAREVQNGGGHNTPAGLKKNLELLQGAVDLDPGFAQAWGDLAVCHGLFWFWNYDHSAARQAQAKAAIDNAVRLAPDLPDVIQDLGTYYYYGFRDYSHALEEYQRLARLRPNDPTVFSSLGLIQRRQGDWAQSLPNSLKATQLDPGNGAYSENLVMSLKHVRRYAEAAAERRRRLALDPDNLTFAYDAASLSFDATGSTEETDRFFAQLPAAKANSPLGINLRRDWARTKGDLAEAVRLDKLQPFYDDEGTPHFVQAFWIALDHLGLNGDLQAAREEVAPFEAELRSRVELEPENTLYLAYLAAIESFRGEPEDALRHAQKAVQLVPESLDALDGPLNSGIVAMVRAWNGDKDEALKELSRLFSVPTQFLNVHEVRKSPWFRPFQGDPKFDALLDNPANNTPLF
jgi:TolB-like protein/Tfp pilus assembly protein PilF